MSSAAAGAVYVAAVRAATTVTEATTAALGSLADSSPVFFYGSVLSALQARVSLLLAGAAVPPATVDVAALLHLLSFGTCVDGDAASDGVKALLAEHASLPAKLQLLSLLTLFSQHTLTPDGVRLSYGEVEQALGISGAVAVQDVVLRAVRSGLCVARLNEQQRQVRVYAYESRNVSASDVSRLKGRLAKWTASAEAHMRDMQ
ncbi:hypothetical protein NESM_000096000 [Novymonas esmeraldas]|uniref:PCI domain-containing protein n=1 Tax=Novymonas esmeraldas TaxID=1808958 RepID=A0AAW0F1H7_9TRYP